MAELQVCMLGTFQVCWDFVPVGGGAWRNAFASKLLRLVLVRRPEPVQAEEAVRLIGGGMTGADLTPALESVNRVLAQGGSLVLDPAQSIRFEAGPRCWIDLDTMLAHYEAGVRAGARGDILPAIMAFQEADGLYQGDLLEELQEPWVQPLRQTMRERYIEILERLADGHAVLARYQDAVGFCHKALAHDPLREATYQRMMIYYYYLGDLEGAEEAHRECTQALENAGRSMSEETVSLWQRLAHSRYPGSPASSVAAALDTSRKPDP